MAVLANKRLLLVTGKGGVGKSTVSSALALACARAGLRTLVCEVNAKERVTQLLDRPLAGPNLSLVEPNLWAVNVQPAEAMREYALMVLKFQSIYNAVFENRLVRNFLRFIPSLQELVMIGKILFHLQQQEGGRPRFDRIIVDAPATGHAITFLSIPQVLLETVPPGPMHREAEKMKALLVDPATTAAVLVALPEEMPVNETLELRAALDRLHIASPGAILNGFTAPRFQAAEVEMVRATPPLADPVEAHFERAQLSEQALQKLERGLGQDVAVVPRLYGEGFDRRSIEHIAGLLAPLLGLAR